MASKTIPFEQEQHLAGAIEDFEPASVKASASGYRGTSSASWFRRRRNRRFAQRSFLIVDFPARFSKTEWRSVSRLQQRCGLLQQPGAFEIRFCVGSVDSHQDRDRTHHRPDASLPIRFMRMCNYFSLRDSSKAGRHYCGAPRTSHSALRLPITHCCSQSIHRASMRLAPRRTNERTTRAWGTSADRHGGENLQALAVLQFPNA